MYVVKIGWHLFYAADDKPATACKAEAKRFTTEGQASAEARAVRETWNLKPARGATPKVTVVKL